MNLSGEKHQLQQWLIPGCRMTARLFLVAVGLWTALLLLHASNAMASTDEWVIECADCPRYFDRLSPRALKADSNGALHVVYGAEHLYHAWAEAGGWQSEVVDDKLRVGREAALAIDQADGLYIVYYDEDAQALRYATDRNGGWQIEELVDDIVGKAYPTIAVDLSGQVHVAYYHARDENLVYATLDGEDWVFEVVDEDGAGRGVSLAVEDGGLPHVSYACEGTCYAVKESTGWSWEYVTSDVRTSHAPREYNEFGDAYYTSLALDREGEPHVVANDRYATLSSVGWRIETIPMAHEYSTGHAEYALALDDDGDPHISFISGILAPKGRYVSAFYATRTAEQWVPRHLGASSIGASAALTVNEGYTPHVVYLTEATLRHVFPGQTEWQTEIVDRGGAAGQHAALALDARGHSHVASFDETSCRPRYVEWNGHNWRVESLEPCVDGRIGHAIGTDQVPHLFTVHHSYIDPEWDPVIYAFRDDTGWHTRGFWPMEIHAPDYRGHALTLDDHSQPHVSIGRLHYDGVAFLDYGHLGPSGEWTFENVRIAAGTCIGDHTNLALDRSGGVHIAYVSGCPSLDHDLEYAHKDGAGWHFDTVDSRGDVGQFVSLALDGSDHPRMSYYDATNGDLAHAVWDGNRWQIELVDREGDVGQYTSLAVDGEGFSHISYYDATNGDLKYARQDETGWQIEVVDADGDVGQYSSLALYGSYPTIAYFDQWRHDLKVARLPFLPTDFQYLPSIKVAEPIE